MDTNNTNQPTNSIVPTVPVPASDAEMTDGITSIARLEDLLSTLPKPYLSDQQNPNPNPSDLLSHYSTFARALTATSDESLIHHFVKNLNGLGLLAEWWAHVADKNTDDVSMTLLKLLERVPIEPDITGSEKIVNLLNKLALNANPKVKETASVLNDKWKVMNSNAGTTGTGTDGTNQELVKDEESTNPNPNSERDETETLIHPEQEEGEEEDEKTASDPASSPDSSSDSVPVPVRESVPVKEKDKKPSSTAYEDNDDMDALEIARQVAIQVEEEVVQYRESLYSSPEQEDSEKDEKAEPAQKDEKPAASAENPPLTESKPEKDEKPTTNTNNSYKESKDSGLMSGTHNVDPVRDSKDGFEGLDLNENLCTDYDATEQGGPIHVSASKAMPSVPVSPHRFETGTGTRWKGTVSTTSAFRPAGSGTGTAGRTGTDSGLKRDSSFLGFDLNIAEQDDGEVVLPPSGDSSTEVSSERAKKLKLDLNRMDEDAELAGSVPVPIDQRLFWLQVRQSRDQSQSSASSSSQKNPNLTRDFDLNDDLSGQGQDRNFINILGSRLMVDNNNNNSVPVKQTAAPLTFHSFLGPTSHSGPYQPYQLYQSQMTQPTTGFLYQHNMVPAQNWYGQPSTSYPVPSHITRQMAGPVPVSVQENGLSVGLSLNPFRPGLDLNAGTGTGMEASSSSREGGTGFRQFFVQSHNGSVQEPEQNSVPVPGTGLRWKDPDCELGFGYGFKQLI